jgi:taspase (threonine aspartase 1)
VRLQLAFCLTRHRLLAGEGALHWAELHGFTALNEQALITDEARANWNKWRELINNAEAGVRENTGESTGDDHGDRMEQTAKRQRRHSNDLDAMEHKAMHDTVGAIAIDSTGVLASGVSSGGIAMKIPGRIGEAAIFGAGCWAQRYADSSIATSVTGEGEAVMKALFAKSLSDSLANEFSEEQVRQMLSHLRTDTSGGAAPAGCIVLGVAEHAVELLWAHNTPSLGIAFATSEGNSNSIISRQQSAEPEVGTAGWAK